MLAKAFCRPAVFVPTIRFKGMSTRPKGYSPLGFGIRYHIIQGGQVGIAAGLYIGPVRLAACHTRVVVIFSSHSIPPKVFLCLS